MNRSDPTLISRRTAVTGLASTLACAPIMSKVARASETTTKIITPRKGIAHLLEPGQPSTPIWGYASKVPGPEIRTPQGEQFSADLHNELPQPTTIHWHGIRIDNAMDGVANLTQKPAASGEQFSYRFSPPDAGTYWYHPHNRTWEQMARGLYGAFIVEEPNPPKVDQDLMLILDDWRIRDDGKLDETSLGSFHDLSHGGRLGNILTLNGAFSRDIPVKAGERLRLRLLNASNARVLSVLFPGHTPTVIALDGQPVAPFPISNNGMRLAPAQRADIILDATGDVGSKIPMMVDTGREKLEVGKIVYHPSERQRATLLTDAIELPKNPMPTTLASTPDNIVDLDMTGGAMSWFESASYRGKTYDVRTLARQHKKVWAFNGIAGMPPEPLARLPLGKTIHVRIRNNTSWPHAMHFHGHHVREVAHSARKPLPHWRDTVFIARNETITVGFHAHNPGKWMLHCHMLEHQLGGMGTWYEVG